MSNTSTNKIAISLITSMQKQNNLLSLALAVLASSPAAIVNAAKKSRATHPELYSEYCAILTSLSKENEHALEKRIIEFSRIFTKISCIKLYRELSSKDLRESKIWVENLANKYHLQFGDSAYHKTATDYITNQ